MGEVTQRTYNRARVAGYLGSAGTGLILFLILFFTYLVTPIPPYPEGGGGGGMDVEVNLGFSETGLGDMQQADLALPDFTQETPKQTAEPQAEQQVISQDIEETANITQPPKTEKKKPAEVKKTTEPVKQKPKKETKPVVEKPRVADPNALYKPNTNTGSNLSQGNTQGTGDQGSTEGSQTSALYGKGGSGGGGTGPGSGGGSGGGTGGGIGTGVGQGISFTLKDRSPVSMSKPAFPGHEDGIVVVEITVDPSGRVISAKPGAKGTTIGNNEFWAAAKKAALESRFNVKKDNSDLQVGTIVYHFKLQ